MSNYLYRLARFAFRRRRLVLAVWLAAAIAAIAVASAGLLVFALIIAGAVVMARRSDLDSTPEPGRRWPALWS